MKFLNWFHRRKGPPPVFNDPQPGEVWTLKRPGNASKYSVLILNTCKDMVIYRFDSWPERSLQLETFLSLYEKED